LFCFQEKYIELYFSDPSRCGNQGKNEKKKIEVGSDSTPCLEVVAIGFVTCRQIGSKPSFLKKMNIHLQSEKNTSQTKKGSCSSGLNASLI
jgi:hypothetical protein